MKKYNKVIFEKDKVKEVMVQELAYLEDTDSTFEQERHVYKDVSLKFVETFDGQFTWHEVWINNRKVTDGEFAYYSFDKCLVKNFKNQEAYFIPIYTEWD